MRAKRLLGLETLRGTLRFYAMLLVCLPPLLSILFFAVFQRTSILNAQKKAMLESLRHEKTNLVSWLDNLTGDLKMLASRPALQTGEPQAIRALFAHYLQSHPSVPTVIFADAQGHVTVDFANTFPFVGDRPYFAKARQGETALSDLLISRVTGTELVVISTPVTTATGEFRGVVFVPFELTTLDKFLDSAPVGQGGSLYLADATGHILAPSRTVAEQKKHPDLARWPAATPAPPQEGTVQVTGTGDRALVVATVPLIEGRWFLVQQRPISTILSTYYRQLGLMGCSALISILLASPLLIRLARTLERPLERLLIFSKQLLANQGKAALPDYPVEAMPAEMRALHDTFCEMAREMRKQLEAAEQRSTQDPLTGLYNRRFLFDGGTKLLEAAARSQRPCSCLMVDVDHFKKVNDSFGHAVGDRVLAHVAGIILACARKSDLVSRYGGEEFAVILTGADGGQGATVAERVRQTLAERPCLIQGRPLPVTVSIGVSEVRCKVEFGSGRLDDLLARADRAMYAAKEAGRDRVVVDG